MDFSRLKNVVWKESEHYVAQSLNVDVSSFGATKAEALVNLREALELYFEDNEVTDALFISEVELAAV